MLVGLIFGEGLDFPHIFVKFELFQAEKLIWGQLNRMSILVQWLFKLRQVPSDSDADLSLEHIEVGQVFFEQVHQGRSLHVRVFSEENKNLGLVKLFQISLCNYCLICLTIRHSKQFDFPNVDLEVFF